MERAYLLAHPDKITKDAARQHGFARDAATGEWRDGWTQAFSADVLEQDVVAKKSLRKSKSAR